MVGIGILSLSKVLYAYLPICCVINMAIATVKITDRNFRITIPEDVREAEKIEVGDIIQIDVSKITPKEEEK